MASERNYSALGWDAKIWDSRFSKDCVPDEFAVDGENKKYVLPDSNGIHPLFKEHKDFFRGVRVDDLTSLPSVGGNGPTAWLDDREYSCQTNRGKPREYQIPLTAAKLHEILKEPVLEVF